MQDKILERYPETLLQVLAGEDIPIEFDHQLYESSLKINKDDFWRKDLLQFDLDREFIVSQGVEKFKQIQDETNVWARLKQFGEFFKIIFTILGFTMAKNKISA
jgi:hypothetical protein